VKKNKFKYILRKRQPYNNFTSPPGTTHCQPADGDGRDQPTPHKHCIFLTKHPYFYQIATWFKLKQKKMKKRFYIIGCMLAIGMIVGMTSCQDDLLRKEDFRASETIDMERGELTTFNSVAGTASTPVSAGGITPYIIQGADNKPGDEGDNRTCAEAATACGISSFEFSSDRVNYNGDFDKAFPDGFTVTTNGTYVSWSFSPPDGYCVVNIAVIVKGGPAANVYFYDGPVYADSGLASPVVPGPSGNTAGLSNLTFCYNLEPCNGDEDCWKGETAWTAGPRYTNRGNWAMYTAYEAGKTVNIIAGQHHVAGIAHFSAVVGGKVTITLTLGDDFRLADTRENVKIQGYAKAPSGNPAPGRFANKITVAGSPVVIEVPAADFYGVHMDVEMKVPCD
jgi:hypothetical protein